MGAIQEPAPQMRNWRNETRGESWWLRRTGTRGDAASVDQARQAFTFPADETPAVLAALAQARDCAAAYLSLHANGSRLRSSTPT